MEDHTIHTPIAPRTPSHTKRTILLLILALLVGIVLYTLFIQHRTISNPSSGVAFQKVERVFDPAKDSTTEYKSEVVSTLDERIKKASSDQERIAYDLEKAFSLAVNRVEAVNDEARDEARNLFTSIYTETKDREGYELPHEMALYGYIFSFAESCFSSKLPLYMSSDLRDRFFSHSNTEKDDTNSHKILQKETFRGFVKLLDDPTVFAILSKDKIFNTYSAQIKSIYLDSYLDELTQTEKEQLISSIKADIAEYTSGDYISLRDPSGLSGTALAPMHIALAHYVIDRAESGKSDPAPFREAYTTIQNVQGGDQFGNAIVLSWLKMYEIGALARANAAENEIATAVNDLASQIQKRPQISGVVRGYLAYTLSEWGSWHGMKKDLFALADGSPSIKTFLDNDLGLKGY